MTQDQNTIGPTETEINRTIHEKLMGKCWHQPELQDCHEAPNTGRGTCGEKHWYCGKCQIETSGDSGGTGGASGPSYTSPESPRSLLDEVRDKATEKVGGRIFTDALLRQCYDAELWHTEDGAPSEPSRIMTAIRLCASATPIQIARAVYECIVEGEGA